MSNLKGGKQGKCVRDGLDRGKLFIFILGGDAKEGVESNLIKQTATQKFGVINLYFYSASVHLTDQNESNNFYTVTKKTYYK